MPHFAFSAATVPWRLSSQPGHFFRRAQSGPKCPCSGSFERQMEWSVGKPRTSGITVRRYFSITPCECSSWTQYLKNPPAQPDRCGHFFSAHWGK